MTKFEANRFLIFGFLLAGLHCMPYFFTLIVFDCILQMFDMQKYIK